jgi:hypothetical protein
MLDSLNSVSGLLMVLSGLLIFAGACCLIATKQRAGAIAAYMVLLPLPVAISICGWLKGSISSLVVIAASPNLPLTSADVAGGLASSLLCVFAAVLVSAPSYLLLAIGLLLRALRHPHETPCATTAAI